MKASTPLFSILTGILLLAISSTAFAQSHWEAVAENGNAHVRHESAFAEVNGRYYLLGGRRIQPVDIFDPGSGQWNQGESPPVEIHHFQAIVYEQEIWVMGALTGSYPGETPIPRVLIYSPKNDRWRQGAEIPGERNRGAAGVVFHNGKIYLVAGIRDGHRSGWVPWLDEYDPGKDAWRTLPDAPRARDHFHAVAIDGKIYAAGGRRSGAEKPVFAATVSEVDVYDIARAEWQTLPSSANLPTQRAGTMAVKLMGGLLIIGGESPNQEQAHEELEWLDPATATWSRLPAMLSPRHGAQAVINDQGIWIAGGSGNRGGGPELVALERLLLD